MAVAAEPTARTQPRYRVSVQEYVRFHSQGFLVVRALVPPEDIAELSAHCDDLLAGRIARDGLGPHVQYADPSAAPPAAGGPAPSAPRDPSATPQWYNRIHMLHRHLPIHERYLLHPRVLDVLEALIGPDVLALQTMLFLKPPGAKGQGYHQDSYYIPTLPDTLCGAWIAIDRADLENGCVLFTAGSQAEPVYPDDRTSARDYPQGRLEQLALVRHASDPDESRNELALVAARYRGHEAPAIADPGDVVFFGGHILHRSHPNRSATRFRRAFVGHYCNARSYTEWDYGPAPGPANDRHILARGGTHLPFAQPQFGTPCAATGPRPKTGAAAPTAMGDMESGMMDTAPTDPARLDPAAHRD